MFTALDHANRELGFTHGDMRIANVMEHRPDMEAILPKGFMGKHQAKDQKHHLKDKMFKLPGAPPCLSRTRLGQVAGGNLE